MYRRRHQPSIHMIRNIFFNAILCYFFFPSFFDVRKGAWWTWAKQSACFYSIRWVELTSFESHSHRIHVTNTCSMFCSPFHSSIHLINRKINDNLLFLILLILVVIFQNLLSRLIIQITSNCAIFHYKSTFKYQFNSNYWQFHDLKYIYS